MDLVGGGTKSAVTFDNLIGATDLGYDMDINASGLQAGLTLTGGVDSGTGNLTITATDVLGAVDTGNVDSGATFTFNASTLGANTIGTIAAKTAVINATNAVSGLTDGTYTIGSKVTLNGPATSVLDSAIVNSATDTSLTVVLGTGTGDDQIAIDTTAGTKTITVSGDTGRSADDIDITLDDYTTDTTSTITVDVSGLTKNSDAADDVVIDVSLELSNDKVVVKGSTDTGDILEIGTANYTTNTVEHTLTNIDTVSFGTGADLMAVSLSGVTTTLVGTATTDVLTLVGTAVGDVVTYANVTNNQIDAAFVINTLAGADTITGTSGVDNITAGAGADTITGGDGRDVFNYTVDNDTTSSTPDNDSTTAAYDTIKDFGMMSASYTGAAGNDTVAEIVDGTDGGAAADVIDITLADTGGTASTLAVAGASGTGGTTATSNVEVSSTGLVTFAAADDTLAEKLVAIAADTGDVADGEAAVFTDGDDSYLFVNDGADDLLIKLEGITVVGLDIMANTGTIGGDDYVLIT
jgi:hypothetical protein